jgi:hypothetical protein
MPTYSMTASGSGSFNPACRERSMTQPILDTYAADGLRHRDPDDRGQVTLSRRVDLTKLQLEAAILASVPRCRSNTKTPTGCAWSTAVQAGRIGRDDPADGQRSLARIRARVQPRIARAAPRSALGIGALASGAMLIVVWAWSAGSGGVRRWSARRSTSAAWPAGARSAPR